MSMTQKAKNYDVVNLTESTPGYAVDKSKTFYRYDDDGNMVLDGRTIKTSTTATLPADEATQKYFNEHVHPLVAKAHGLEFDDKGGLKTPLSSLVGFDPEKERQRREQEQKLNEAKRKEAQWYNGISVLMDIATAAGGGNVQKRTPTDVGAKAVEANKALQAEQTKEDYAVNAAVKDKMSKFYADLLKVKQGYDRKVTQDITDKPFELSQELRPEVKKYKQQAVRHFADQNSGGGKKGGSGGSGSARYLGYTVMVNGQPENRSIAMDIGTYDKISRDITAHYRKLYNAATGDEKKAIGRILEDMGVRVKTKGGYEWVEEYAMSQGLFYMLPDEIKKEIVEKTNGEIQFVAGEDGYDVIQPKGTVQPFRPPQDTDSEEEELMGSGS